MSSISTQFPLFKHEVLSFSSFLDSANFALNTFNGSTWTKTKGTANNFITMDAQPAQNQGEIQFHNYLVFNLLYQV